jgi:hypothetical protein
MLVLVMCNVALEFEAEERVVFKSGSLPSTVQIKTASGVVVCTVKSNGAKWYPDSLPQSGVATCGGGVVAAKEPGEQFNAIQLARADKVIARAVISLSRIRVGSCISNFFAEGMRGDQTKMYFTSSANLHPKQIGSP